MKKTLFLILALVSFSFGNVTISNAYIKVSPNTKVSAAFLTITNDSQKEKNLLGVKTKFAKFAELHTHKNDGEMMKMVKIDKITIPANSSLSLKPGAEHIMLFELANLINEGDKFDLELEFDDGALLVKDVEAKKSHHKTCSYETCKNEISQRKISCSFEKEMEKIKQGCGCD